MGLDEDEGRFVGPGARKRYFDRLKLCTAQRQLLLNEDDGTREALAEGALTPRQRFWRRALELRASDGVLPFPVLLRRKANAPNTLNLRGAGCGDATLVALTTVLAALPALDTLLLSDNNLTDAGFTPLLETVRHLPNLTALDLSGNDMDDSAATLRDYLGSEDCTLVNLTMKQTDIDDWECADFMDAVLQKRRG